MMALITVFFPGDPYRKAIIDQAHLEYFLDLGASRTPPKPAIEPEVEVIQEAPKTAEPVQELPPKKVSVGDQGFGRPGSLQFHELEIKGMNEYRQIRDYVFGVCKKKMREKKNGTPESYRKTALMLIKRWINGS